MGTSEDDPARLNAQGFTSTRPRGMDATACPLLLSVAGCVVRINCGSPDLLDVLVKGYGAMRRRNPAASDMNYLVRCSGRPSGYRIFRPGRRALRAADDGELIFRLEKELTIELQHRRRDLYFLHAAALDFDGKGVLLVAPSGGGKSTLTWALLHYGFAYLSDELAPVDLGRLRVLPYPHALCLKQDPPPEFPLPRSILRTSRTMHVPTTELPSRTLARSVPLTSAIFLEYSKDSPGGTELQRIGKAEATTRLFAQALNPLAHPNDGLSAAAAIAHHATCYRLVFSDLRSSCDLITNCLSDKAPDCETLQQSML